MLDLTAGKAATYTPGTTATVIAAPDGRRAGGDLLEVSWAAAREDPANIVTVYVDGTLVDGGSTAGKVGIPVRMDGKGRDYVPIRGASQVAVAASSAFGTITLRMVST